MMPPPYNDVLQIFQTSGYVGLTCSLELGVPLWTRWEVFGSFANLIGPRGNSVSKG